LTEPESVSADPFLARLPPIWPDTGLRSEIRRRRQAAGACVVAFDDDPTGTQTVAGVQVVYQPSPEELDRLLQSGTEAFYLLTNSRSLYRESAASLTRSLAVDLAQAARRASRPILAVSRSDSTLRGHFPAETDALAQGLGRNPSVLLIPFFAEGGRYTVDDVHWVQEGGNLVPAAQTAFARDPIFGYAHSWLPGWVEEKTNGGIRASDVRSLSIGALRQEGPEAAERWLDDLTSGVIGIINATHDRDLEVLSAAIRPRHAERVIFRSAASWVKILAGLPDPSPVDPTKVAAGRGGTGLIVVGSIVPRTDEQLARLRRVKGLSWIELQVQHVLDPGERDGEIKSVLQAWMHASSGGHDAVIYTTRAGETSHDLAAGKEVSAALVEVVRHLTAQPRYLVAKGGITASDIATEALGMRSATVLGPILPGVPVWELGEETRWPGLPLIVFPGNVGEADSLAGLVRRVRP
jgi:uncharacterized protein YgbK (DUF1537 family)